MIFLEIKYDRQGFTVVIGCEFCTLWGEEGVHDIKGGKYVPLDYIQIVSTQKCCHIKKCYCILPLVSHSVHLSEGLEGEKINVLTHTQRVNLVCVNMETRV